MFAYIVLGIVQGLTEFLPISSSGHLILAGEIFNFHSLDPAFDVFVQGGTVISVLVFFRREIITLSSNRFKLLIIASLPAVLVGLILSNYIDLIFSSLWGATLGFSLTTLLLLFSRQRPKTLNSKISVFSSLKIGFSQALAILPGLSRSGSTITTSLILGIPREEAFTFSFLLSIPAISGATILSLNSLSWSAELTPQYLIGFFVASITGYISLVFLSRLVKQGKFYLFAPYTAILSILSLSLSLR